VELWLSVEPPGDRAHDVAVDVEAETPERVVLDALVDYFDLGRREGERLWWAFCPRLDTWLGDEAPVVSAGLRTGDRLALSMLDRPPFGGRSSSAMVELVVVGGPAEGGVFRLAEGGHLVGRTAPPAQVPIADQRVSSRHLTAHVSSAGVVVVDEGSMNGTRVDDTRIAPGAPTPVRFGQVVRAGDSLFTFRPARASARAAGLEGASSERRSAFELVVVGGPAAGRRVRLAEGQQRVGRSSEESDIPIPDPSMSGAHLLVRVSGEAIAVTDLGSMNGTELEGARLSPSEEVPVQPGQLVRTARSTISFERAVRTVEALHTDLDGTVPFNRPPRVSAAYRPKTLSLSRPPDAPQPSKRMMIVSISSLTPGIASIILALSQGGKPVLLVLGILLTLIGAAIPVYEARSSGVGNARREGEAYRRGLASFERDLAMARSAEAKARRESAPDAGEVLHRVAAYRESLWERRPGDIDFLHLRVGASDQPAQEAVQFEPGGDPALRDEADAILARHASVPLVPVMVDLVRAGVVGVTGEPDRVVSVARWLVTQAAALHSPRDVAICLAVSERAVADWDWAKWLPHTHGPTSPLEGRSVAAGRSEALALFAGIRSLLAQRRSGESRGASGRTWDQFVVLVVDEQVAQERHLVEDLLMSGDLGVGVIWLASDPRDLPGPTKTIVELRPGTMSLRLTDTAAGTMIDNVTADGLDPDRAAAAARALGPLRDQGAMASTRLASRVSLLGLLDLGRPTPEAILERWRATDGSPVAVVGARAEGPAVADLGRDGPHVLVVGTGGAGKTAFLQTLVASLAATVPPNRLSIRLVDGQGGSAIRECAGLPHVVGPVEGFGGDEGRRLLDSLRDELARREEALSTAGVRRHKDLVRRAPDAAPPLLVVVVDEPPDEARADAALLDELGSFARRARSVGIHLVVALPRLADAAGARVLPAFGLRVALRTRDEEDGLLAIGSPETAHIPRNRRGRAFLQTEAGLESAPAVQFQVAFAGGWSLIPRAGAQILIRDLSVGRTDKQLERRTTTGILELPTDLERLAAAVEEATARSGLRPSRS
jgi:S-DNA-T family DNA segregation ATPase FtsK/SpoIIIE